MCVFLFYISSFKIIIIIILQHSFLPARKGIETTNVEKKRKSVVAFNVIAILCCGDLLV
jgi:hypothetical protein